MTETATYTDVADDNIGTALKWGLTIAVLLIGTVFTVGALLLALQWMIPAAMTVAAIAVVRIIAYSQRREQPTLRVHADEQSLWWDGGSVSWDDTVELRRTRRFQHHSAMGDVSTFERHSAVARHRDGTWTVLPEAVGRRFWADLVTDLQTRDVLPSHVLTVGFDHVPPLKARIADIEQLPTHAVRHDAR